MSNKSTEIKVLGETMVFNPGDKVIALKGNTIKYYQDFADWEGVPIGVVFTVDKPGFFCGDNTIWLKAPGYGGEPYGNGKIGVRVRESSVSISAAEWWDYE